MQFDLPIFVCVCEWESVAVYEPQVSIMYTHKQTN